MSLRQWEAYAMRYATVQRTARENFIAHDVHDAASSMDYFVWFLRSGQETLLVDTGFNEAAARQRKRTFLRCPIASLAQAGVRLDEIRETVITHAHYDHEGEYELRPGVTVHWVGGHTRGLQIVRVHTRRGWIVLASDASHYLDNLRKRSPFPIVADAGQMLNAYELVERLAESPGHIIAGHDPLTCRQYRQAGPDGLEIYALQEPAEPHQAG